MVGNETSQPDQLLTPATLGRSLHCFPMFFSRFGKLEKALHRWICPSRSLVRRGFGRRGCKRIIEQRERFYEIRDRVLQVVRRVDVARLVADDPTGAIR